MAQLRNSWKLLVVLLALAGCGRTEQPKPATPMSRNPKVTVQTVAVQDVVYAIDAAGSVEASEEISIPARVSGAIDAVRFKEGDRVDEKTVLVEIEVEKFRLGEERAQADFDRARAQAALTETVYKNRLTLYEEGRKQNKDWVTEEQMATWRADVDKAKADLERARVDLELARRDHRDAEVRSPIKGQINRKLVSIGEFVRAETVVATILNISTLHVRFTVTELEASRLTHGQEVTFRIRSAPDTEFRAKLFFMSQKADAATRAVECKAEVLDANEILRPGTFASIHGVMEKQTGIVVPERAVVPTERGFLVFTTDGKKAAGKVVKLGLRREGGVEVTEGIAVGDRIVVDGAPILRDGQGVDIAGEAP